MGKQTKTYWDIIELLPPDRNIEDEVWMPVDICLSSKVNSCHLKENSLPEIYSHHGEIFAVWNDFLRSFCLKGPHFFTSLLFGGHMWWAFFSLMSVGWWFKKYPEGNTWAVSLLKCFIFSPSYSFVEVTFRHHELATVRENKVLVSVMLKCFIRQKSAITNKSVMHYIWPLFTLHCL